MSKERIIKALKALGFTCSDIQVYVFLEKEGPYTIKEIAIALNLHARNIRTSLRELQTISIVEESIENRLEFSAMPFEEVIDLFIEVKKEQAKTMKQSRNELLSTWKTLIKKNPTN
ncbi:helix-turn-helix domain-containing protein [Thermoproteota archaeon]